MIRRGRKGKQRQGEGEGARSREEERRGVTLGTPWTQLELDQDIPTKYGVVLAVMFRVLGVPWSSPPPPCRGPTSCLAMPGQCYIPLVLGLEGDGPQFGLCGITTPTPT